MTFQVQGRIFAFRGDNNVSFNLKRCGIPNGFSLYNGKSRQYLCPDQHGNVDIIKGEKYLIRKIFNGKIDNKLKGKGEESLFVDDSYHLDNVKKELCCNDKDNNYNNENKRNNSFMKFCQEYREKNKGTIKVTIKEMKEKWDELDSQTKKDKYHWKGKVTGSDDNNKDQKPADKKRIIDRHVDDDDDSHSTKKQKMKKEIDQSIKNNENKEQKSTWKKIKKESFSHNNNNNNVGTNKNDGTKSKKKEENRQHDSFDSLFGSDSDCD